MYINVVICIILISLFLYVCIFDSYLSMFIFSDGILSSAAANCLLLPRSHRTSPLDPTCLCLGCPRHPGALCGTARPGNVFDCWIQPPPFGFKVRMIGETGAWGIEKQGRIKNIQKWSNNCLHPDNKCAAKMMQAGYNDGIGQLSSHSYA